MCGAVQGRESRESPRIKRMERSHLALDRKSALEPATHEREQAPGAQAHSHQCKTRCKHNKRTKQGETITTGVAVFRCSFSMQRGSA